MGFVPLQRSAISVGLQRTRLPSATTTPQRARRSACFPDGRPLQATRVTTKRFPLMRPRLRLVRARSLTSADTAT
jgi:hypothetical protein